MELTRMKRRKDAFEFIGGKGAMPLTGGATEHVEHGLRLGGELAPWTVHHIVVPTAWLAFEERTSLLYKLFGNRFGRYLLPKLCNLFLGLGEFFLKFRLIIASERKLVLYEGKPFTQYGAERDLLEYIPKGFPDSSKVKHDCSKNREE